MVGTPLCFTFAFSVAGEMESISPVVLSPKGWGSLLWRVNIFLFSLCDKWLPKMQMLMHILSEFVIRVQLQAVIKKSPLCSCNLRALLGRGGLSLSWLLVLFWLRDNPPKAVLLAFFKSLWMAGSLASFWEIFLVRGINGGRDTAWWCLWSCKIAPD